MAYRDSVFVNCPFDSAYRPIFRAIVFAIHDCGFVARCALEESDSATVRVSKIEEIVAACRLGIHDLSRTELDKGSGLPRFNMPLELGLFLGARRFGDATQQRKVCLVLDRERFRYQAYLSDLAGQDIANHHETADGAIRVVRDWLSHYASQDLILPGGRTMVRRCATFNEDLPAILEAAQIEPDELIFNDFTSFVVGWLLDNPRGSTARPGSAPG